MGVDCKSCAKESDDFHNIKLNRKKGKLNNSLKPIQRKNDPNSVSISTNSLLETDLRDVANDIDNQFVFINDDADIVNG